MINAIGTTMSAAMPTQRAEQSLSADQKTLIEETLAQFDGDNLTQADAASIVEAFAQAGIEPSKVLATAMDELGFDAKAIGDLANGDLANVDAGHRPPPPKQSSEEITSMVEYLSELVEEKLAENSTSGLTDADKEAILVQVFDKFDIERSESIINTTA
ncbi:hypothetical protein [Thalassotalea sp. PLHSN55]|uniref:hypothetical protein n=1 Tax=Thalassotalea sp. PLHSN55 TaxID=3435888 RepID=UPI003F84C97C